MTRSTAPGPPGELRPGGLSDHTNRGTRNSLRNRRTASARVLARILGAPSPSTRNTARAAERAVGLQARDRHRVRELRGSGSGGGLCDPSQDPVQPACRWSPSVIARPERARRRHSGAVTRRGRGQMTAARPSAGRAGGPLRKPVTPFAPGGVGGSEAERAAGIADDDQQIPAPSSTAATERAPGRAASEPRRAAGRKRRGAFAREPGPRSARSPPARPCGRRARGPCARGRRCQTRAPPSGAEPARDRRPGSVTRSFETVSSRPLKLARRSSAFRRSGSPTRAPARREPGGVSLEQDLDLGRRPGQVEPLPRARELPSVAGRARGPRARAERARPQLDSVDQSGGEGPAERPSRTSSTDGTGPPTMTRTGTVPTTRPRNREANATEAAPVGSARAGGALLDRRRRGGAGPAAEGAGLGAAVIFSIHERSRARPSPRGIPSPRGARRC